MTLPQRVLVTGGAGYIGSHFCKALAKAGSLPVTFDNLSRGHADAVKWGPLVVGDLRDTNGLVARTLEEHRIEAVVHFAALAYVGESVHEPQLYYDNNLDGMMGLLGAMHTVGLRQIVFSSSCATYGTPARLPISEDDPQTPINPYGRSKLACEWMLRDADVAWGLKHVALRYFNAAGADPEGEASERHDPETHLLPIALAAASGQGPSLGVFGTDYPTADGTCVRDYIHVSDLARAHLLALEYLARGSESIALNLGTGQGASVREVVDSIERVTGRPVPLIEGPRRAGDPPALFADPRRAKEVLGFETEFGLDRIVADAAPWFGHVRQAAPEGIPV